MGRLTREAWDHLTLALLVRSGGLCEARTPACMAGPDGRLSERRDGRSVPVNRHHRLPRGAGGTDDPHAHDLDRLLLVCGAGNTAGCHGYLEQHRTEAYARGWLVPRGQDSATWPLELAGGRLVLLDPDGGFYLPAGWRLPGGGCPVVQDQPNGWSPTSGNTR